MKSKQRDIDRAAEWNRNHPKERLSTTNKWRIRRVYGLKLSEYAEMLEQQEGICAIASCSNPAKHIDHCHKTGKVRGILCRKCNSALGFLGDNVQLLEDAIEYLKSATLKGGTPIPWTRTGMSLEARQKRSEEMKGNTRGFQKGHKRGIGRKFEPETLAKMRQSAKARWDSMTDEKRRIQWNKEHPTRASAGEKPSHHGKVR
jgi:hypothetical protein